MCAKKIFFPHDPKNDAVQTTEAHRRIMLYGSLGAQSLPVAPNAPIIYSQAPIITPNVVSYCLANFIKF